MNEPMNFETWGVYPAGGKGERLFPISTPDCPKPFCPINDGSGQTFIQATQARAEKVGVAPEHAVVITTNPIQTALTKKQLLPMGVLEEHILEISPEHDYAGAMCVAGEYVYNQSKGAVILNMAADQWVDAGDNFVQTVTAGIRNAYMGNPTIVTIEYDGIDFGTICGCGHAIDDGGDAICRRVIGFVEKPDEARARKLIAAKNAGLNTGINIWRADTIHRICQSRGDLLKNPLSTDGLMKLLGDKLSVVKGNFPWLDCGSLDSYHRVSIKTDDKNNSIVGPVIEHGCEDSLIMALDHDYELEVEGAAKAAIICNEVKGVPVVVVADKAHAQQVRMLAESFARNSDTPNIDFGLTARNNVIVDNELAAKIRCGFVGVDKYKVEPKVVEGRKVIRIFQQLAAAF